MAIFPFSDWFYNLSQKQQDLEAAYNKYLCLCETINATGVKFDHELTVLQEMTILNYGLIIVTAQTQMSESDYAAFLKHNAQLPPPHPSSATWLLVVGASASMLGLGSFASFVWNLKKALTPIRSAESGAITRTGSSQALDELRTPLIEMAERTTAAEQAGITGDGATSSNTIINAPANAGVQPGTEAGLDAVDEAVSCASPAAISAALSGLAILVAVGIDMILGAIDGKQQSDELADAKARLDKALGVIEQFSKKLDEQLTTLQDDIAKQEQAFVASMNVLSAIQQPMFALTNLKPIYANRVAFLANMRQALNQYGYLTVIRSNWISYQSNEPDATWSGFVPFARMLKPSLMPDDVANNFLTYAENNLIDSTARNASA